MNLAVCLRNKLKVQKLFQFNDEDTRNRVKEGLQERGIPSMVYYPKAMHEQLAFAPYQFQFDCSVTEVLCKRVLSLPMHPYLQKDEVDSIVSNLEQVM